jgi:hypothetical protein
MLLFCKNACASALVLGFCDRVKNQASNMQEKEGLLHTASNQSYANRHDFTQFQPREVNSKIPAKVATNLMSSSK